MQHALVISEDAQAAECLEDGLWNAGFRSIFQAADGEEALAITHMIRPSLIVVAAVRSAPISAESLFALSEATNSPIVVATADPAKALQCLGPAVSFEGPHPMAEIGNLAMPQQTYSYAVAA